MKLTALFFLLTITGYSQFHRSDSIGNFYVIKDKLVWQKNYYFDDINALDQLLKNNDFTSDLNILKFGKSTLTKPYKLVSNNLPQYARSDYKAFLVIDVYNDTFRVSIKDIIFPDFEENYYYNGMKQDSRTGSLEDYILRQDGNIKRNSSNLNVLNSFDNAFSEVFDYMGTTYKE